MLAMPSIDILGRKKTYAKIWEVLNRNKRKLNLPLDAISLISPKHELNQLLRSVVTTGKGISGIRFSGNVINGTLIEDTYIYSKLIKNTPSSRQMLCFDEEVKKRFINSIH
ncbi:hypothetical protein OKW21_006319 [Catalinimonas alkaloidigena]|uniref:hypothetical protein n=1 Tax=Catalinimonas alkaloidigena TaxID=1075417 RepID=UPI002406A4BA|nr:hypothetical protein [Catalinimonas alkaloidigena]MDF9801056.1 hypothetical protein [Catalinimonas alkaloidigena]